MSQLVQPYDDRYGGVHIKRYRKNSGMSRKLNLGTSAEKVAME